MDIKDIIIEIIRHHDKLIFKGATEEYEGYNIYCIKFNFGLASLPDVDITLHRFVNFCEIATDKFIADNAAPPPLCTLPDGSYNDSADYDFEPAFYMTDFEYNSLGRARLARHGKSVLVLQNDWISIDDFDLSDDIEDLLLTLLPEQKALHNYNYKDYLKEIVADNEHFDRPEYEDFNI